MKFSLALALVSLTATASAYTYEFNMYAPNGRGNATCTSKAEHIADDGERPCSGYFINGATSAWKLKEIKKGCTVTFYGDRNCQNKLDWIDDKSPKDTCKHLPAYEAAQTFDVKCS